MKTKQSFIEKRLDISRAERNSKVKQLYTEAGWGEEGGRRRKEERDTCNL